MTLTVNMIFAGQVQMFHVWYILPEVLNPYHEIPVNHFHKNTVKSDENSVNLQSSMQFLPTRLPIILLQRVEEEYPAYREIMVSAMCLCADNRII